MFLQIYLWQTRCKNWTEIHRCSRETGKLRSTADLVLSDLQQDPRTGFTQMILAQKNSKRSYLDSPVRLSCRCVWSGRAGGGHAGGARVSADQESLCSGSPPGAARCGAVRCRPLQLSAAQCSSVQPPVAPCSSVQLPAAPCSSPQLPAAQSSYF